ncbi:hypothetical protein BJV78DRAFT_1352430 [Lactifluus subvellereus]|nr:hypothetical protein BJV78DRAFT_1352430 [Lactifluus subvellereus]
MWDEDILVLKEKCEEGILACFRDSRLRELFEGFCYGSGRIGHQLVAVVASCGHSGQRPRVVRSNVRRVRNLLFAHASTMQAGVGLAPSHLAATGCRTGTSVITWPRRTTRGSGGAFGGEFGWWPRWYLSAQAVDDDVDESTVGIETHFEGPMRLPSPNSVAPYTAPPLQGMRRSPKGWSEGEREYGWDSEDEDEDGDAAGNRAEEDVDIICADEGLEEEDEEDDTLDDSDIHREEGSVDLWGNETIPDCGSI